MGLGVLFSLGAEAGDCTRITSRPDVSVRSYFYGPEAVGERVGQRNRCEIVSYHTKDIS
jgi:hypothetical protein